MIGRAVAAALAGYAIGTTPVADFVARLAGPSTDLRAVGTGNPGAANAAATLGPKFGLAIMAGDIAKGVGAGRVGRLVAGHDVGVHIAATAAVVGHCLPAWNGFKGGKGVATSVGQVLVSFPAYFPIDAAVAVATAALPWWKQRTFAATATASVVWIGASTVWWRRGMANLWGPEPTAALPISAAISSGVIYWRFIAAHNTEPEEAEQTEAE